jgi:hypothetical protein
MSDIPEPADKLGQRHDLLRRFSNPWIGLLGTIFSVVGVGLAIYFYIAGARTRKLTYTVIPVKTIVVKSGEASTLRVLHGDQELKGDVTAAQVAIWDDGAEFIRPDNALSPISVVLCPPAPILEARIRKVSREVIGAAIGTSRLADGVVPVTWKILEHNDGAVIQLIFAGSPETNIAVEGTVEGQPTVLRVEPSHRPQSFTGQVALERSAGVLMLAMAVVALLLFVGLEVQRRSRVRSRAGSGVEKLNTAVFWLTLVLVCIGALLAWRGLRQPGPPFGF